MDKLPIAMPMYNRPQYLKRVLDALKQCSNVDKFYIETFEENEQLGSSATIDENTKVLKAIDWIEIRRNINPGLMGCAANVVQAIDCVCQNNDFFVVLEDDVVPAIDFLNLMLFGFRNFKNDIGWVQGHSLNAKVFLNNKNLHDKVLRYQFFVPWGWGSSRNIWLEFRKDYDVTIDPRSSWAKPLGIWLLKKKYFCYKSLIGRTQNIGEIGAFQKNPEKHRKYVYNDNWYGFTHAPVDQFDILDRSKTEFADPTVFRAYMSGVIAGKDFRKCFRNWKGL